MRLGANYLNYDFTSDGQGYGFGVVATFHLGMAKIQSQLTEMAKWAKFIRLPLCMGLGLSDGINLDNTDAHFTPQQQANFITLLKMIKNTGFEEIEITLCPQGNEAPQNWTAWDDDTFNRYWALLYWVIVPTLQDSGMVWWVDLINEMGSPHQDWATKDLMIQYVSALYGNYYNAFGNTNTVGSSLDPSSWGIQQMPRLYNSVDPKVWPARIDTHIYRGVRSEGWLSAVETYLQVDWALTAVGYTGPLGLPEFPFNPETYMELLLAIRQSKREVPTLAYWPAKYWLPSPGAVNFIPGEPLILPPGNEDLVPV